MTATIADDVRELLFDIAPVDLQERADEMTIADRGRLAEELQSLAMHAIWRAAYLDSRYGSGCGDQGHRAAVKAANKALVGLRHIIGFTYPERGAIHV